MINNKLKILDRIIEVSLEAGKKILEVYNTSLDITYKKDNSPLTKADKLSNQIIEESLKRIASYPILSEEGINIPFEKRKKWEYFWLVDPLDGTKEFIKKNGEFTVNIALIYRNRPVLGVVYAPALNLLFYGGEEIGSFKMENNKEIELPVIEEPLKEKIIVVASKSHLNEETKNFIKNLEKYYNVETKSIGSSLKICLLAEGIADIYPRIAPTMEWDTAAAHAILSSVGGNIVQFKEIDNIQKIKSLPELEYNKENLKNPNFIAYRKNVF